jgi:hypothetical protein
MLVWIAQGYSTGSSVRLRPVQIDNVHHPLGHSLHAAIQQPIGKDATLQIVS